LVQVVTKSSLELALSLRATWLAVPLESIVISACSFEVTFRPLVSPLAVTELNYPNKSKTHESRYKLGPYA
jgi:hypothetical protein